MHSIDLSVCATHKQEEKQKIDVQKDSSSLKKVAVASNLTTDVSATMSLIADKIELAKLLPM